jgi:hypothetical protein
MDEETALPAVPAGQLQGEAAELGGKRLVDEQDVQGRGFLPRPR